MPIKAAEIKIRWRFHPLNLTDNKSSNISSQSEILLQRSIFLNAFLMFLFKKLCYPNAPVHIAATETCRLTNLIIAAKWNNSGSLTAAVSQRETRGQCESTSLEVKHSSESCSVKLYVVCFWSAVCMGTCEPAKELNLATWAPPKYVGLGPVQMNRILEVDHDPWHCGICPALTNRWARFLCMFVLPPLSIILDAAPPQAR